ncbi:MAG: decaprenyl-phosphate phosphoribosyltransferase [Candidatus Altiarchaeota archaeon]
MNQYLKLLRVQQWYKNLVIFLALFFTNNMLNTPLLLKTVYGFISLCMVSSSYYILNDIRDRQEDRNHPEKRKRPIASGEVGVGSAVVISLTLVAASLALAYSLSTVFALFPIALFLSSMAYTLKLKDIAFVDVHMIALNFLIRAVSGAVLIGVTASPWLITTVFFMALFLGVSKRKAEYHLLGKGAVNHKSVYNVYNEKLLNMLIMVITTTLLFNYSLYTFIVHEKPYMMLTIPFATFMIFRYLYFVSTDHVAARKTEYLFKDMQMVLAFFLWMIVSFLIIRAYG